MSFLTLAEELPISPELEQAKQAVFKIQGASGFSGHGSGFFFGNQNTFVTAFHVVENFLSSHELPTSINMSIMPDSLNPEEEMRWRQERQQEEEEWKIIRQTILEERKQGMKSHQVVKGNESYRVMGIRALDVRNDLAILDVEGYKGPILRPLDSSVENKSETYLLGFSRENSNDLKIQTGKVNIEQSHSDYFTIINNTLEDLVGSSGGPVVGTEGQVIGIFSMGGTDSNVAFATAVRFLHNLLNQHKLEDANNLSDQHKITAAYIRLSHLVDKGDDALAEWKYEMYQQSKMSKDMFGWWLPYDYGMEQDLPHLRFYDDFYDEDGLPIEDEEVRSKQLLPRMYYSCQNVFHHLLK